MFADPTTVKWNPTIGALSAGTDKSLAAISRRDDASVYRVGEFDDEYKLSIMHQIKPQSGRYTIRLDKSYLVTDAIDTSMKRLLTASAYIVIMRPLVGVTNANTVELAKSLIGWCSLSTNLDRVVNGET